jgi:hypothetical protein
MSKLLLLCALLVQSTTKIKYLFTYNYDTLVQDLSGNGNHGKKPASGSSTAVNTPYGLYLDKKSVTLPPNAYGGIGTSNALTSSQSFASSQFIRYLPGNSGTIERGLMSFSDSTGASKLKLMQAPAPATSPPVFELSVKFSGPATSIQSSAYNLSKLYLDQWYFFVVSIDSHSPTTDATLCINGGTALTATHNSPNTQDFSTNKLNGLSTKAIYYSFQFEDTSQPCSFFDGSFDLGSCSYVCFEGGASPFSFDTYQYDATGTDCGASCINYGCVNSAPLECYTSTCPPPVYDDANCSSCYANSVKTTGADSCSCRSGYTQTAVHPLTCVCPSSVSTAYSNSICSSCFPHSIQDTTAGTCSCDSGYFNSALASVACSGKT